jgi:hypothetical protein
MIYVIVILCLAIGYVIGVVAALSHAPPHMEDEE